MLQCSSVGRAAVVSALQFIVATIIQGRHLYFAFVATFFIVLFFLFILLLPLFQFFFLRSLAVYIFTTILSLIYSYFFLDISMFCY